MKLITVPEQGVEPLLAAINGAKKSIEIAIFRFDRKDLQSALTSAAARGVRVNALIADSNRGGEKLLRALEMRFLDAGITVARTANDLVRYHNKMMIVDREGLYVLSFNFTHLDTRRSRGFGIFTTDAALIQEAAKLFEADSARTKYKPELAKFVVSPANARDELREYLGDARKQLLIYDPEISDPEMLRVLKERAKAGVEIRVIGRVKKCEDFDVRKLRALRLHTRTIVRDSRDAFVGSQSLRALELDHRREVGIVVGDSRVVKTIEATFEADWQGKASAEAAEAQEDEKNEASREQTETKTAEVLMKELRPVARTVKQMVKKVVAKAGDEAIHDDNVKHVVKKIVKKAVKEAVSELDGSDGERKTA